MTAAYLKGPPAYVPGSDQKKHHSCHGKVGFISAAIALRAAKRRKGRQSYHCSFCGLWHVGTGVDPKGIYGKKHERKNLIRREEREMKP